jgi:glycosyltransferase involved in cell wall biosynthesis
MNDPVLTICIVNYNSSDFIDLTLVALKRLTRNPYRVIIRDNGSSKRDIKRLRRIVQQYEIAVLYEVQTTLSGSLAHGTGLNDLVQRIDTEYGVILDADATFLVPGWDQMLIDRLTDRMPIYGTQADIGSGKPEDFPLMFAVLFKTSVLQSLQIDFRPQDIQAHQDTGWELREKYRAAGYEGGLLYSFNTRTFKRGPFANVVCTEYYGTPDGTGPIVASHFGRGSAPKAKALVRVTGATLMARILNKALTYVNMLKWKQDKRRWIALCGALIHTYDAAKI